MDQCVRSPLLLKCPSFSLSCYCYDTTNLICLVVCGILQFCLCSKDNHEFSLDAVHIVYSDHDYNDADNDALCSTFTHSFLYRCHDQLNNCMLYIVGCSVFVLK